MSNFWIWPILEITDIKDGDTVQLVFDKGFGESQRMRVRFANIDVVEKKDPGGTEAIEFIKDWIYKNNPNGLYLITHKSSGHTSGIGDGSFGRWLGEIVNSNEESLTQALRDAGFEKKL